MQIVTLTVEELSTMPKNSLRGILLGKMANGGINSLTFHCLLP